MKFPVPFCVTATCFALSEIPATATWRHSPADSSQLVKAHSMDFVICCIKKTNKSKGFLIASVYCASVTYLLLLDCWYVMHVWYRWYVSRTHSDFLTGKYIEFKIKIMHLVQFTCCFSFKKNNRNLIIQRSEQGLKIKYMYCHENV